MATSSGGDDGGGVFGGEWRLRYLQQLSNKVTECTKTPIISCRYDLPHVFGARLE